MPDPEELEGQKGTQEPEGKQESKETPSDDYVFTVDGKEVRVARNAENVPELLSKGSHYTQEMQSLRQQQRDANDMLAGAKDAVAIRDSIAQYPPEVQAKIIADITAVTKKYEEGGGAEDESAAGLTDQEKKYAALEKTVTALQKQQEKATYDQGVSGLQKDISAQVETAVTEAFKELPAAGLIKPRATAMVFAALMQDAAAYERGGPEMRDPVDIATELAGWWKGVGKGIMESHAGKKETPSVMEPGGPKEPGGQAPPKTLEEMNAAMAKLLKVTEED